MNVKELTRRASGRTRWYEVPWVDTRSVSEYFALPKKDREWYGLYKLPYALPWERPGIDTEQGWDSFYVEIKKQYPVQYFFRQWLFSFDNPVYSFWMSSFYFPFREFKYAVKRWFNPIHPRWRASLPRHAYCDISELLVNSNFALIRDFYWEEVVDGFVDWQSTEDHRTFYTELITYVRWIEEGLPELEERYSKSLANVSRSSEDYHAKYKETFKIEQEKYEKETEILIWFAKNRSFFWT